MMFPAQQWALKEDTEPRVYGFVDNELGICLLNGEELQAFVVVPTELFLFLPLVFPREGMDKAKEVGVWFYLDEHPKEWIFGVETKDGELGADLWPYTKSRLPGWVKDML